MGVNNRQRRAAKRRKQSRARRNRPNHESAGGPFSGGPFSGGAYAGGAYGDDVDGGGADAEALAARMVIDALRLVEVAPRAARTEAGRLVRPGRDVAPDLVASKVRASITTFVASAVASGWTPGDLAEIVRRRLSGRYLPALAAVLAAEADRHPADTVVGPWRAELEALGPSAAADPRTVTGMEHILALGGLLLSLPRIAEVLPPPGAAPRRRRRVEATAGDAKQLARARALLAKAESTDFDEEAEALSAKAQELISRYSLDRLLRDPPDAPETDASADGVSARRVWIDAPYVLAKSALIDAVAAANRCRAVVADKLGFSTIVGDPVDLDAVDLLATSLLVQADSAMLRHGRQADHRGTSRTRSFRHSFLMAYAYRIGERLRAATDDMVAETGRTGELLPVLHRHEERVDALYAEMFPHVVSKGTSISNTDGWSAGRAAADLARLDARPGVTAR